jgi:hypothetical protein
MTVFMTFDWTKVRCRWERNVKGYTEKVGAIGVIKDINLRPYLKEDIMEILKANLKEKRWAKL